MIKTSYAFLILAIGIALALPTKNAFSGEKAKTELVIETSQGEKIKVLRTFGKDGIEEIIINPSASSLKSALNDNNEVVKMQARTALNDLEEVNRKKAAKLRRNEI